MAEQRSVEWFTARRGKLTASNLGAALGQVSYTSRAEALRRALGTDEFKGNVATEHGTNNEMNGIVDYQIMTGNLVEPTGLCGSTRTTRGSRDRRTDSWARRAWSRSSAPSTCGRTAAGCTRPSPDTTGCK